MSNTKKIAVLGSTGSVGTQALDVAEAKGLSVAVLTAGTNHKAIEQKRESLSLNFACWMMKKLQVYFASH